MKLLSFAIGAATAAASASSSSNTATATTVALSSTPNNNNNNNENNNNRLTASSSAVRSLQDSNGNSYAYIDDLSGYQLQYSNCLRVKIPQENDDDAVEGNVNFYNGAYRAQYAVFATFHVCGDGGGSSDQCYDCDYGVEYATEVNQFLEVTLDHWENYCGGCQDACGGGNNRDFRRRLDEAQEVDCSVCSDSCANYYQAGGQDDDAAADNDETNYMECQEAFEEDGLQLYYGPQCSSDGRLVIGVFYDDECTIKTKHDSPDLGYHKFDTVADGCVDCTEENGAETCQDMYGESYHCFRGKDQAGRDDEMSVCSAVKKAFTVIDYGGVKKRKHGSETFLRVFFGLLSVAAIGGFFFLTFTYYIRHRGEKGQPMLSSDDVHEHEAPPGGTLT